MTPFRQLIKPGQVGSDVRAVKRALVKMNASGSKSLKITNEAGASFVSVLKDLQSSHKLKADGIYGSATHKIVAPHFDAYGIFLYKLARLRKTVPKTAQQAAQRLLVLAQQGKYHADNPGDMLDVQATAQGKKVRSRSGALISIDKRVFQTLVWLIDVKGYTIGTYAVCSDHSDDGAHGHAGGYAVDISSINHQSLATGGGDLVHAVLHDLHAAPFTVRQLISGGFGSRYDSECRSLCIPSASYYGEPTLSEHQNHIHVGF